MSRRNYTLRRKTKRNILPSPPLRYDYHCDANDVDARNGNDCDAGDAGDDDNGSSTEPQLKHSILPRSSAKIMQLCKSLRLAEIS